VAFVWIIRMISVSIVLFRMKLTIPPYGSMAWCLVEHRTRLYGMVHTRVYPKVSGLDAWSENCKWYNSLPLGCSCIAVFVSHSSEFCHHNPLCCFSTSVYYCC
jgi:hypothetical protein